MKKLFLICASLFFTSLIFFGCQENNITDPLTDSTLDKMVGGYNIVLLGGSPVNNGDGTYTWIWSITNTNSGNGKKGTWQDLSHWTFQPGACLVNDDIVSAAYGTDLNNLNPISNPEIKNDPSTDACYVGDVFKFNFGTSGSTTTYYKLVINKNYSVDPNAIAYWKAGPNCGTGTFDGIGCYGNPDCNGETACSFGPRYVEQGNWATYTPYSGEEITVTLFAGQTLEAGTVTFSAPVNGEVTISILLNPNWSLQSGNETVKIQGYEDAPSGNPAPGGFTTSKGSNLTVTVPAYNFYGVHVDVQYCNE